VLKSVKTSCEKDQEIHLRFIGEDGILFPGESDRNPSDRDSYTLGICSLVDGRDMLLRQLSRHLHEGGVLPLFGTALTASAHLISPWMKTASLKQRNQ
jgi:hypothetical protein